MGVVTHGLTVSSSICPSQSSSRPLPGQVGSSMAAAGAAGVQLSVGSPALQPDSPVLTHTPWPQLVGTGTKSSSASPLQSSSTPSQVASSLLSGSPGTHALSTAAEQVEGVLVSRQ